MRVLAFDASSTTGWASFADARSAPVLGHFEIEASVNYGNVANRMAARVTELVANKQPDIVAFEAPIFLPRDRWHTRRLLTCLVVAIEMVAERFEKRCIEISPSDVKKALGGSHASKGKQMANAIMMGWPVKNDHEADACGVALATYAFLRVEQWRMRA